MYYKKYSCRNRQKKPLCIGLRISIWAAGLIVLLWVFDLILFLLYTDINTLYL